MKLLFVNRSLFANSMGGIRSRRLVKGFAEAGVTVTAVNGPLPPGPSLPESLPPCVSISVGAIDLPALFRQITRQPTDGFARRPAADGQQLPVRSLGLSRLANRWFMFPDKHATWIRPAVKAACRAISKGEIGLVYATAAPVANLFVARRIARKLNIPFVAEYRDLWTASPYPHLGVASRLHRAIHLKLERSILRDAVAVVCLGRGIADYLNRTHPGARTHVHYNFFDPDEYPDVLKPAPPPFRVSYIGNLYPGREIDSFAEGMRQFALARNLDRNSLIFSWVGSAFGLKHMQEIFDRLSKYCLVEVNGPLPHHEALAKLAVSHVALVVQSPDDRIHIPGKLFEAFGARTPVMLLAPSSESREIVTRCRAGRIAPHEATGIAQGLTEIFDLAACGKPWPFDESETAFFSSANAIQRLRGLFEELPLSC